MDFTCGLSLSKGYAVIFVVIDYLSKYGHFVPLKSNFSNTSVTEVFIKVVFKFNGLRSPLSVTEIENSLVGFGNIFLQKWVLQYKCPLPIIHK